MSAHSDGLGPEAIGGYFADKSLRGTELGGLSAQQSGGVMRHLESAPLEQVPLADANAANAGALSVLIVEPSLDELVLLMSRLNNAGFQVTAAESFAQARPILASQPPSILITALRLGAYNGLHLVLRGKTVRPDMAALVTSPITDSVLQADAEAMGATFVVTPITERELIGAVLQTFFRDESQLPIRPPFERRMSDRRAAEGVLTEDRRGGDRRRVLPWLATGPNTST